MKKLVYDTERLNRAIEKFREERKRSHSFESAEALAESLFRLALHPRTPVPDAIRLLLEARRIDDTNPRYSYHLARLYISLGSLETACRWLKDAVKLCPTSHRLWAHIAILHHELNDGYKGRTEYEPDGLRKKADRIISKIRGKENTFEKDLLNFTPPKSLASVEAEARKSDQPAPMPSGMKGDPSKKETSEPDAGPMNRFSGEDECRWSGVIDLEAERHLEQEASRKRMETLTPLLGDILERSRKRKSGIPAFVISAVQWLIIGYPVSSIRKLKEKIEVKECPEAMVLLDHICSLFEMPAEDLPRSLADSLSGGRLPPLIIALIHDKRLLWRKIEFPASSAYRSAKQLLDPSRHPESEPETAEKSNALIRKLISAANKLNAPPPPAIVEAAPSSEIQRITPEAARDIINQLESSHQNLKNLAQEGFDLLKGDLEPRMQSAAAKEAAALVVKDHVIFTAALNRLQESASNGLSGIERLQKQILGIPSDELDAVLRPSASPETRRNAFTLKMEECKKAFNELNPPSNLRKIHARIGAKLASMPIKPDKPADSASPKFVEWSGKIESTAITAPSSEGTPGSLESPADVLDALWIESTGTSEKIASYWTRLKQMTTEDRQTGTLTPEQATLALEIRLFINSLPKQNEAAILRITEARRMTALDKTLEKKATELESRFKEHLTAQGRFGRHLVKLALPAQNQVAQPAVGGTDSPRRKIEPNSFSGPEGLGQTLQAVDDEVDSIIDHSLSTFDAYTGEQRGLPELKLLEMSVLMQAATTLHRLGKSRRARLLWQKCLHIDRLYLPALKNIAVCDTLTSTDHGQTLLSWKSYCEVLYFHAIATDNPRVSALARSDFHKNFAWAFANGFLWDSKDQTPDHKGRVRKLIDLLNSPGLLREFVAHKQAEFLNRWFEMRTPVLLLGRDRSLQKDPTGETDRKKNGGEHAQQVKTGYKDMLDQFIDRVCQELPERIGRGFRSTCVSRLQSALSFCETTEGLTLANNPNYHADESHLIEWIEDVYRLKFLFFFGFSQLWRYDKEFSKQGEVDWGIEIKSIDSLLILDRLNDIPTQFQKELVEAAANGIANELKTSPVIIKTLDTFIPQICSSICATIFSKSDSARFKQIRASLPRHKEFWRKISNEWAKSPDENNRQLATLLDDPRPFYPDSVNALYQKETPMTEEKIREIISDLEPWCKDFPELTGPARLVAFLFSQLEQPAEAIPHLERCLKHGISVEGVKQCREMLSDRKGSALVADAIKKKEYRTARDLLVKELESSPDILRTAQQLLGVYNQWIKGNPEEAHSLIALIDEDIDGALRSLESSGDEETRPEPEILSKIIENKRQLMVAAALAPVDRLDTPDKCRDLLPCFEEIQDLDKDNLHAVYYYAFCLFQSAAEKYHAGTGDRGESELRKAASYFERVIHESPDNEMKTEAVKLLNNIKDVLKTM